MLGQKAERVEHKELDAFMQEAPEFQNSQELIPLPKHVYPRWVRWFGVVTLAAFCITLINFIWYELPIHRRARNMLLAADAAYRDGSYDHAITLYGELLGEHPTFKEARIGHVKALFASCSKVFSESESDTARAYLICGMLLLQNGKYSRHEIEELKRLLPVCYWSDFASSFVTA